MFAKPIKVSHFGETFCLVLSWMEATNNEEVWVWEADEKTGRLVLIGEADKCKEFQATAEDICNNCEDPNEHWRYYG